MQIYSPRDLRSLVNIILLRSVALFNFKLTCVRQVSVWLESLFFQENNRTTWNTFHPPSIPMNSLKFSNPKWIRCVVHPETKAG
jgi:hypothetical protein